MLVALAVPTLLSATPKCDGTSPGIELQWSAVSGATNYEVYRDGFLIFTTATAGTTFWNVTGLSAGFSYGYQVRARSGSTTSGSSNSLSAVAPTTCVTVNPSLADVGISPSSSNGPGFSAVTVNVGASFRGYYYVGNANATSRSVGLGMSVISPSGQEISDPANDTTCSVPANATGYLCPARSFTVPSTAAAGTYNVVFAIWSGSPGASTQYASATRFGWLVVATTLGTPTLLSATPKCDGTSPGIELQWSAVSGATNYEVYRDGFLIFTTATAARPSGTSPASAPASATATRCGPGAAPPPAAPPTR